MWVAVDCGAGGEDEFCVVFAGFFEDAEGSFGVGFKIDKRVLHGVGDDDLGG